MRRRLKASITAGTATSSIFALLETSRRMFEPDLRVAEPVHALHAEMERPGRRSHLGRVVDSEQLRHDLLRAAFSAEPFVTFLQNSQDLWFDQMGDGKRVGAGAAV